MKSLPIIKIKEISKSYKFNDWDSLTEDNTFYALKKISLEIFSWDFVAIIWPSGSWKSTLMNILWLLDWFDSWEYILDWINIKSLKPNDVALYRCNKIWFIFQSFNLINRYSILDNVYLPSTYNRNKEYWVDYIKRAKKLLSDVWLGEKINKMPNQLSWGQRQRVAIARALINNPKIILADEPTGNLDSISWKNILWILKSLNEKWRTVIIITHDSFVAKECKKIFKIKDWMLITN